MEISPWEDLGIFTQIPAYSDILKHNEEYSPIIQAYQVYSEPYVTLTNSKTWYIQYHRDIQNPCIFRTLASSELDTYSEHYIFNKYKYKVIEIIWNY